MENNFNIVRSSVVMTFNPFADTEDYNNYISKLKEDILSEDKVSVSGTYRDEFSNNGFSFDRIKAFLPTEVSVYVHFGYLHIQIDPKENYSDIEKEINEFIKNVISLTITNLDFFRIDGLKYSDVWNYIQKYNKDDDNIERFINKKLFPNKLLSYKLVHKDISEECQLDDDTFKEPIYAKIDKKLQTGIYYQTKNSDIRVLKMNVGTTLYQESFSFEPLRILNCKCIRDVDKIIERLDYFKILSKEIYNKQFE